MSNLTQYPRALGFAVLAAVVTLALLALGAIDFPTASAGILLAEGAAVDMKTLEAAVKKAMDAMQENIHKVQDTAMKALEEIRTEGTLHAATNKKLTEVGEAGNQLAADYKSLKDRMQDVEQKMAKKPAGGDDAQGKTAGQAFTESQEYKDMLARKEFKSYPVTIQRKTIANATGQNQPLVPADRLAGINMPALRRMTIRDLLPQIRTSGNLVEFCRELVFTNAAAPQYDTSSPTPHAEGAPKAESNITFELDSEAVITLAHWIGASRQVLSDAPMLSGYIDSRLSYGLKLEEEDELLNSTGANGELNGLVGQATAFTGGATNQTTLDTIAKAFLQVTLSEYEASALVLNPGDWVTRVQLAKDTTGRYLFSDPHSMEQPRVWGKPVVPTQAMTLGSFLTGAFDLGAAIYDREDITIRVSDQHSDFFIKNLVAILCEERLALVVYRSAALVTGSVVFAG